MSPEEDEPPFPDLVEIPIEAQLDLHRFLAREIEDVVEGYLEAACERGFREVRIIHGRGRGVQRARVHRVLAKSPWVERFAEAPAELGGWGATQVWLRPSPS